MTLLTKKMLHKLSKRYASTLRKNVLTGNWTIFASGRSNRPKQTASSKKTCQADHPSHLTTCPFCTGNESKTPPELLRINDTSTGDWSLRVIPNAFPAVTTPTPEWQQQWQEQGDSSIKITGKVNEIRDAIGFHEVVVETPKHNNILAEQDTAYMQRIVLAWRTRGRALIKSEPSLESILYFKNNGSVAGASLIHPHSQIVALPLVPRDMEGRHRAHLEYWRDNGKSVWDASLEEELQTRTEHPNDHRIIDENDLFLSFVPFAAISPYHVYVVPKFQKAHFEETDDLELDALSDILSKTLKRQHVLLDEPDYNLILRSAPLRKRGIQSAFDADVFTRWHVVITPRLGAGAMAGFELGSGMFSNGNRPESDAQDLREVVL